MSITCTSCENPSPLRHTPFNNTILLLAGEHSSRRRRLAVWLQGAICPSRTRWWEEGSKRSGDGDRSSRLNLSSYTNNQTPTCGRADCSRRTRCQPVLEMLAIHCRQPVSACFSDEDYCLRTSQGLRQRRFAPHMCACYFARCAVDSLGFEIKLQLF